MDAQDRFRAARVKPMILLWALGVPIPLILIIMAIMLTRRLMGEREAMNEQWPLALAMSAIAFLVIAFILTLASNSSLLSRPGVGQVPAEQTSKTDARRPAKGIRV